MWWIVVDSEDGLMGVFDNHEEALREYEKCKEFQEGIVADSEVFEGNERVVLAKIERDFYGVDSGEKADDSDDVNVWVWKEDVH